MIVYAVTNLGSEKMARIPHLLMGLLVLSCLGAISDAKYTKYRDPKQPLNARIKDLLKRMTLEEKIGQMVQIDRTVASSEVLKKYFIGSVLSGGGSVPAKQASPETWIDMVNDFQKGSLSTRLGIPMIYGIDAVHGHNNVYKATVFPHNIGLGATRQVHATIFHDENYQLMNKLRSYWFSSNNKKDEFCLYAYACHCV
ncbi:hypothetical protein FEM48_Zijuj07G0168800 [Ziziphus jujuba var. spinosa]|uniref:Glycoside hydrolase family 3 N-terminal domain-containing protein n=1 Tax=Ziziphus jujuba var. spinosa TaxID=714518 RepID=A0A978V5U1_ZIZJJ|nr:hypothetical protein FEM48_Zijuj07G0168800 [Ziziphus jujuba var. spinosa]